MSTDYSESTMHKEAFTINVFKKFTDACGGDPNYFAEKLYKKYTVEDFGYHDDVVYFGVLGYFEKVVAPHKIAVYNAGIELLNSPWFAELNINKADFTRNLWLHDLSKFSAEEAFGYAFHDFKHKDSPSKDGFEKAWNHHKNHNEHHPEYWLSVNRDGTTTALEMPKIYVLEMIADWIGAGKTYGSTLQEWLPKNLFKFEFHPQTLDVVQFILEKIGIKTERIDDETGRYLKVIPPEKDFSWLKPGTKAWVKSNILPPVQVDVSNVIFEEKKVNLTAKFDNSTIEFYHLFQTKEEALKG